MPVPHETVTDQKPKPSAPDWERIEADYRAGIKTLREIGSEQGITHTAINKRAKSRGWIRDLKKRIRQEANAKVSKILVTREGFQLTPTEQDVVAIESEVQARIQISHRADVSRAREIVSRLLEELNHQSEYKELYEQLGQMLESPDKNGVDRLGELYHKVIGMNGRVGNIKQLSDALRSLVSLEREVYGIVDRPHQESELETLLRMVDADA